MASFLAADCIADLKTLKTKWKEVTLPKGVQFVENENSICFLQLAKKQSILQIQFYLEIDAKLCFTLAADGVIIPREQVAHITKEEKIMKLSEISNILAFLAGIEDETEVLASALIKTFIEHIQEFHLTEEKKKKLYFLCEQLGLALVSPKKRRYSSDLLAAATLWKNTSTSLYKQLLEEDCLSLPSLRYLQRLSKPLTTEPGMQGSTETYLKARIAKLSEREKLVVLLIDEIHCAQRVEYAGGKFYGMEDEELCKTVLTFMIKSVAGKFSDVVALFPIKKMDAKIIFDAFNKVLKLLCNVGFYVTVVSVDNATANRRFYAEILCHNNLTPRIPHLLLPVTPMFLLFDSTHNFKNIYNNFVNKKEFLFPGFEKGEVPFTACFCHLEELYQLELGKPVKIAYKLNDKVLHPSAIEKTNVKLADAAFHESTIAGLEFYASLKPDWRGTVKFLKLVRRWWNIVNVKTPNHGIRKKDESRKAVTEDNQASLQFLLKFDKWLKEWKEVSKVMEKNQKCLTNETFTAVSHTSRGLVALAEYLLEEKGFSYVLLGQVQSDPIERRFGWYRHLGGSNYFISVRQILEAEKSIRLRSLLKFSELDFKEVKDAIDCIKTKNNNCVDNEADTLFQMLDLDDQLDFSCMEEDKNIIFYVAGYIARSICKQTRCSSCVTLLKSEKNVPEVKVTEQEENQESKGLEDDKQKLIEQINRGGLFYPSDFVYVLALHAWKLFSLISLKEEAKQFFLSTSSVQLVFVSVFENWLEYSIETKSLTEVKCELGDDTVKFRKMLAAKMFNMCAKNVCSNANSDCHKGKKRESSVTKNPSVRKVAKLQSKNE